MKNEELIRFNDEKEEKIGDWMNFPQEDEK